jgi:hypothetical protein
VRDGVEMICETKPINRMTESELSATIWALRAGTLETKRCYSTLSEGLEHFCHIGARKFASKTCEFESFESYKSITERASASFR